MWEVNQALYKYRDRALSKLPGREVLLFRAAGKPRSDEHRRTRKESSWRFRGPVTLPSQGRVHRSPGAPGLSFSKTLPKILTSHKLQQIGGRSLPPICYNCESKIIISRSSSLQVARKRYYSSGQLGENLDLMNIVERERRAPGGSRGPVTLPSQGRVHRSPPGTLLSQNTIKF